MNTVLVVDDEHAVRDSIRMILEYEKYAVKFAQDGRSAFEALRGGPVDLVLLDIKMPGMDGIEVLQEIRRQWPLVPVIMISGHGTSETASEAARLGAYEFLPKPPDRDRLLILARNAIEVKRLRETGEPGQAILGESMPIRELRALIDRVAPTESRVLITGDNGTGKELVARAIHRHSPRNTKPLVEVNCAAIPNELIESELFGHEKGAFTDATQLRVGLFEAAEHGSVFLDEIGELPLTLQAKLLKFLDSKIVRRVGGSRDIAVDVRILAATNRALADEVRQGRFREDLYYRLNVVPIEIPPLRDRAGDPALLARLFVERIGRKLGKSVRLNAQAERELGRYAWPGNVRELMNVIERGVLLARSEELGPAELAIPKPRERAAGEYDLAELGVRIPAEGISLVAVERAVIEGALARAQGNVVEAAKLLHIGRGSLRCKMRRHGLGREEPSTLSVA